MLRGEFGNVVIIVVCVFGGVSEFQVICGWFLVNSLGTSKKLRLRIRVV